MNINKLKLGKMYTSQINIAVMQFDNPSTDLYSKSTKTIYKENPFIPIEIINIQPFNILNATSFFRIKVLLTDGTIWYFATDATSINPMKELNHENI